MVLHTWGQNLMHHPHVHAIVTGGGLSPDGSRWMSCRPRFFRRPVFSGVFRGFIHAKLLRLPEGRPAQFFGQPLTSPSQALSRLSAPSVKRLGRLRKTPLRSTQRVLKYLARYTHGVAISNRRLIALHDGRVSFRYKDYALDGRARTRP